MIDKQTKSPKNQHFMSELTVNQLTRRLTKHERSIKKMTLYELTNDYINLLALAEDPDTDPEVLADTLEGLDGQLEDKADNYAKVIRQIESDVNGLKAEIERLQARKTAAQNNIDRMKANLEQMMIATDKTKFKTELFSFGIQKNPAKVVMDEQYIENVPEEYLKYKDPEIDRKKIAEDLRAGKDLGGIAHLEQSESLRIR